MFRHIYVIGANPTELFIGVFVAEPFDEVPELCFVAPVDLGINNLFNLEMLVTINDFHRGWRRFFLASEWIWSMKFELGNMEDRVDPGERLG